MYRNAFGLDPLVISRTMEEVPALPQSAGSASYFHAGARTDGLINVRPEGDGLCTAMPLSTTGPNLTQVAIISLMDYITVKIAHHPGH